MNTITEKNGTVTLTVEGALSVMSGTILKIVAGSGWSDRHSENYLLRTDEDKYPFVSLSDGSLYESLEDDCRFEIVEGVTIAN